MRYFHFLLIVTFLCVSLSACKVQENNTMTDAETEQIVILAHDNMTALLEGIDDNLEYWNNNDFQTIDDITKYEDMWYILSKDASSIVESLDAKRPSELYSTVYEQYTDCIRKLPDILKKCTHFDANSNGQYTGDEMKTLLENTTNAIVSECETAIALKADFDRITRLEKETEDNTQPPKNNNNEETENLTANSGSSTTNTVADSDTTDTNSTQHSNNSNDKAIENTTSITDYNTEKINSARHSDSDAFFCAKHIVEASLKAPSTAKFCQLTDATVTHLGNGEYMVEGWVDAENSFGAMLRNNFIVTYTATKDGYTNGYVILQ